MPKLREKPDPDEALRKVLRVARANLDCTQEELAKTCRIDPATLCRKLKQPERFTLEQIRLIVKSLHLTDEDICRMVRG